MPHYKCRTGELSSLNFLLWLLSVILWIEILKENILHFCRNQPLF